jgi:hypothetical protein
MRITRTEDRAVDEAIALQQRAGVDVVTGEMRRYAFYGHLMRWWLPDRGASGRCARRSLPNFGPEPAILSRLR